MAVFAHWLAHYVLLWQSLLVQYNKTSHWAYTSALSIEL